MKRLILCLSLFLLSSGFRLSYLHAQDTMAIGFWNMENMYDTLDDKTKNDDEFLPTAKKQWTSERYNTKLSHHAKVIHEMNNGKGPDMLGMSEVENRAVVEDLTGRFLSDIGYKVAHLESPDERGIDVALIYKAAKFTLLSLVGDTVELPTKYPTRLILHVTLVDQNTDTLHVFVNHWPSRRGGEDKSEINRIAAASVLRRDVDALLAKNERTNIVIMGDFNDEPNNASIDSVLKAAHYTCDSFDKNNSLQNLAWARKSNGEGTLKYRDNWNLLDQIIVSNRLIKGKKLQYICNSFEIFKPEYIVTKSGKYEGSPFPTYGGDRYLGGYSDHFPVLAKFTGTKK